MAEFGQVSFPKTGVLVAGKRWNILLNDIPYNLGQCLDCFMGLSLSRKSGWFKVQLLLTAQGAPKRGAICTHLPLQKWFISHCFGIFSSYSPMKQFNILGHRLGPYALWFSLGCGSRFGYVNVPECHHFGIFFLPKTVHAYVFSLVTQDVTQKC